MKTDLEGKSLCFHSPKDITCDLSCFVSFTLGNYLHPSDIPFYQNDNPKCTEYSSHVFIQVCMGS